MSGMDALASEMAAAARHLVELHGRGMSYLGIQQWERLAADQILGVASAEVDRYGGFQFVPLGDRPLHMIVAVHEDAALIDIAAFRPDRPGRWALRVGIGAVLGDSAVEDARRAFAWGELGTLALHATPLDWLRAGGSGACVIDDWSRETANRVRDLRRIEVASTRFAKALRLALTPPPPPLPEISVQRGREDGERPAHQRR